MAENLAAWRETGTQEGGCLCGAVAMRVRLLAKVGIGMAYRAGHCEVPRTKNLQWNFYSVGETSESPSGGMGENVWRGMGKLCVGTLCIMIS